MALAAAPLTGSVFTGWSGACSGAGACVVTMDASKSVTATFAALPSRLLIVSKTGTGDGTVTSNPAGITCGAACAANFPEAPPWRSRPPRCPGSAFVGWSGACSGAGACVVTMDASKSVTATFAALPSRLLTVSKTGNGDGTVTSTPAGITCGAACAANFPGGTTVTLAAAPLPGSVFAGWSGACLTDPSRLSNLSSRGMVQTGDDVLIGGFTIVGSAPKKVLIRARGPSLAAFGTTGTLSDPVLQLYSGQTMIGSNDNWANAVNAAEILSTGLAPVNAQEAAILTTLNPGPYTTIVSGAGGGTGVGMLEVFEMDQPTAPFTNLSARGQVQTGDNVMIGGFILEGTAPRTVLVTARGPSLAAMGVPGALANPAIALYSGQTAIASNDDWGSASNAAAIQATGLAPTNSLESAILITLNPGAYTAIVSGANGTIGVGIVELFAQ